MTEPENQTGLSVIVEKLRAQEKENQRLRETVAALQVVNDYIEECERKLRDISTAKRDVWIYKQQGALAIAERLQLTTGTTDPTVEEALKELREMFPAQHVYMDRADYGAAGPREQPFIQCKVKLTVASEDHE